MPFFCVKKCLSNKQLLFFISWALQIIIFVLFKDSNKLFYNLIYMTI